MRERLAAFFDFMIGNMRAGRPPQGWVTTRGPMELGSAEGGGLEEDTRGAFAFDHDTRRRDIALGAIDFVLGADRRK